MKYSRKKLRSFPYQKLIIIFIIVVVVYLFFFSGFFKKDCGQDTNCFNSMAQKCKPSTYLNIKDGSYYEYKIKGSEKDNCIIYVKLEKMAPGSSIDLINSFQGKDMICSIPKQELNNIDILDMESFLNYCTGPLKEAIYELMIKKLYGLIIQNMGDIVTEIQKQLYEIK